MKVRRKRNKNVDEPTQATTDKRFKSMPMSNKLQRKIFNTSSYDLAKFLLGKVLVRKLDNEVLKGRIVETECYPGGVDKASSTFGNRRTPANEPLYMQPGTAYIYMTYGMYHCFNISSTEPGGAVLLRALEPLEGMNRMQEFRTKKRKVPSKLLKEHELCSGPSKLCMGMDITKNNCNKLDLCDNDMLWIESDPNFEDNFETVKTRRVGIDRAGPEWAKKPFRFYILHNLSVSKRDQKAEEDLESHSL